MKANIFKQYDIRGIAGTDLKTEDVAAIGGALAGFFAERGENRVVLCQDVRDSSPRIAAELGRALAEGGMRVTDIGIHPTPVAYFATHALSIPACVMVTASHNPAEYNGMKICSGYSSIFGQDIARIRDMAMEWDGAQKPGGAGYIERYDGIADDYIKYICGSITPRRSLSIAIDAGNGSAGPIAERLYTQLGCHVYPMFCEPDPSFPNHHPDPTIPANLEQLKGQVLERGLDMGLAFDGDGDRLGVIDGDGNIIWGDGLQVLFWRQLLEKCPGAEVLVEVKCSQALYEEAGRLGGRPFFHQTGHSLIKDTMKKRKLLFAGEMSGHMFFADEYFGFDDALYAGARLVQLVAGAEESLSELASTIPAYHATPEIRLECDEDRKTAVMQGISGYFQKSGQQVVTVDGVRVLFEDGWGLLRQSNTQPVIVMRAEGKTPEAMERIAYTMQSAFDKFNKV